MEVPMDTRNWFRILGISPIPIRNCAIDAAANHATLGEVRLHQVRGHAKARWLSLAFGLFSLAVGLLLLVAGLTLLNLAVSDCRSDLQGSVAGLGIALSGLGILSAYLGLRRAYWSNARVTVIAYTKGAMREVDRLIGTSRVEVFTVDEFSWLAFGAVTHRAGFGFRFGVGCRGVSVQLFAPAKDPDLLALCNLWIQRMVARRLERVAAGDRIAWVREVVIDSHGVMILGNHYEWQAINAVLDEPELRYELRTRSDPSFCVAGNTSEPNWWIGYGIFLRFARTGDQGSRGHKASDNHKERNRAEHGSPAPPRGHGVDIQRIRDLAVLGLDESADVEDVRVAFRRLVKVHHPDRFAHSGPEAVKAAERSFMLLREAFERLTAVQRKAS